VSSDKHIDTLFNFLIIVAGHSAHDYTHWPNLIMPTGMRAIDTFSSRAFVEIRIFL